MKKTAYQSKSSQKVQGQAASYKDRNLAAQNPLKAQEEIKPTEAAPVSMRKRMAGAA